MTQASRHRNRIDDRMKQVRNEKAIGPKPPIQVKRLAAQYDGFVLDGSCGDTTDWRRAAVLAATQGDNRG